MRSLTNHNTFASDDRKQLVLHTYSLKLFQDVSHESLDCGLNRVVVSKIGKDKN